MAGDWETDDLVGVLRLFLANRSVLEALDGGWNLCKAAAKAASLFESRHDCTEQKISLLIMILVTTSFVVLGSDYELFGWRLCKPRRLHGTGVD